METNEKISFTLALIKQLNEYGSWSGETHVQKTTYLLQSLHYFPEAFPFMLYKHGPFSFELRDFLSELRANYLLEIIPQYPYGSKIKLTKQGEKFLREKSELKEDEIEKINRITERFASSSVSELEKISTALLVIKEKYNLDQAKQAEELRKIKPHIAPDKAQIAVEEARKLLREATY